MFLTSNFFCYCLLFAAPLKSLLNIFDETLIGTRSLFFQSAASQYLVTIFPGLPPAATLTRNSQLIYPRLLGGL